jgi:hypothetical protein
VEASQEGRRVIPWTVPAVAGTVACLMRPAVSTVGAWAPLIPSATASIHAVLGAVPGGAIAMGLGAASVAAALFGSAWAPQHRGPLTYMAATALGIACAPLLGQSPMVALACAAMAALACAAVTAQGGGATLHWSFVTNAASLTGSAALLAWTLPMGGNALGLLPGVVGLAAGGVAASALARAGVACLGSLAPSAYAKAHQVDEVEVGKHVLDLPGLSESPTIFGIPKRLLARVEALRAQPMREWQESPLFWLDGPAGTGKTMASQGIAQALDAKLIATTAAALGAEQGPGVPTAAFNLMALLGEASTLSERRPGLSSCSSTRWTPSCRDLIPWPKTWRTWVVRRPSCCSLRPGRSPWSPRGLCSFWPATSP